MAYSCPLYLDMLLHISEVLLNYPLYFQNFVEFGLACINQLSKNPAQSLTLAAVSTQNVIQVTLYVE